MARTYQPPLRRLALILALVVWPGILSAQQPHLTFPRLELRGGVAGHGAGDCGGGRTSSATVGVDVRTHGRWIASAAVDGFLYGSGCFDLGYTTMYQGQRVDIVGWPVLGPRMSLSLGYGFSVSRVRTEVTVGFGAVLTRDGDSRRAADDWTWFDWQGGAVTVRLASGPGMQFELGRHQLAERYFLEGQDVLVAESFRWERMCRFGLSFPVLG